MEGTGESQDTQWLTRLYRMHCSESFSEEEEKEEDEDGTDQSFMKKSAPPSWCDNESHASVTSLNDDEENDEGAVDLLSDLEVPEPINVEHGHQLDPTIKTSLLSGVSNLVASSPSVGAHETAVTGEQLLSSVKPPAASSDLTGVKNHELQESKSLPAKSVSQAAMEDYSPHQASDGSNLSATQENTPRIYEKYYHDNNISPRDVANHEKPQDVSDAEKLTGRHSQVSHSYEEDDTGAVKFSFPNASSQETPYDKGFLHEDSDFNSLGMDLQTPAPIRPPIQNMGSVMGATQLFIATQPSSSNAGNPVEPSSSRPSPDIYNDFASPKQASSSPLLRRLHPSQPSNRLTRDAVSSPWKPLDLTFQGTDERQNTLSDITEQETAAPSASAKIYPITEPLDIYISRKQSQERRQLKKSLSEDHEYSSQFSDDDYLDIDGNKSLRSKRNRDLAVKELANVSISLTPKNVNREDVEVPGTNRVPDTHRRRSISDEYIAQCYRIDGRDSQQDLRIADSQSRVADMASITQPTCAGSTSEQPCEVTMVRDSSLTAPLRDGLTSSHHEQNDDVLEQVPGLDLHTDSLETSSDTESPQSPFEKPATQALSEISVNRHSVPSRAHHKAPSSLEGEGLVPGTSPQIQPSRPYGDLDDADPAPSYPEVDLTPFNFTQDEEFNNLVSTSSPVRPANRRNLKRNTAMQIETLNGSETPKSSRPGILEDVDKDSNITLEKGSNNSKSIPQESTAAGISEYVTAPEEKDTTPSSSGLSPLNDSTFQNQDPDQMQIDQDPKPITHASETVNLSEYVKLSEETSSRVAFGQLGSNQSESTMHMKGLASAVKRSGLRTADQVKGPSKALRGKLFQREPKQPALTPVRTAAVTPRKRNSRSSRRQSERLRSRTSTPELEPTTPMRPRSGRTIGSTPRLFDNMVFSVSYGGNEKDKLKTIHLIAENGGRILENGFDELFEMNVSRIFSPRKAPAATRDDVSSFQLSLTAEAQEIGFTCLIADDHSRRPKYMQALALGLPCISGRWIQDCVSKREIISWEAYLLAAGVSTFLGNAIRSRTLLPYDAKGARFVDNFVSRKRLLDDQSILVVVGKGRAEERKKSYLFLTQALGPQRIHRVTTNFEAQRCLFEAENEGNPFDWVYVSEKESDAEKAIFGHEPISRKRKRGSGTTDSANAQLPNKVRIVSDEFVIQSLILGKLLD